MQTLDVLILHTLGNLNYDVRLRLTDIENYFILINVISRFGHWYLIIHLPWESQNHKAV